MFLICLCKLLEIEKDRSQNEQLYGCSPVWVLKCRVRLADRGNDLPQYRQICLSLLLILLWWLLLVFCTDDEEEDDEGVEEADAFSALSSSSLFVATTSSEATIPDLLSILPDGLLFASLILLPSAFTFSELFRSLFICALFDLFELLSEFMPLLLWCDLIMECDCCWADSRLLKDVSKMYICFLFNDAFSDFIYLIFEGSVNRGDGFRFWFAAIICCCCCKGDTKQSNFFDRSNGWASSLLVVLLFRRFVTCAAWKAAATLLLKLIGCCCCCCCWWWSKSAWMMFNLFYIFRL